MRRKFVAVLLACAFVVLGLSSPPLAFGGGVEPRDEGSESPALDGGSRIIDIHEMFNADSLVMRGDAYSGDCEYLLHGGDVGTWRKESNSGDYKRNEDGSFATDANGSYVTLTYPNSQGWLSDDGDAIRLNARRATASNTDPAGNTSGSNKYLIWSATGETVDIRIPRTGLATGVNDAIRLTADDGADGVTIPLTGEPSRFLDVALTSAYGPCLMVDVEYADGTHHVTENRLYTDRIPEATWWSWQGRNVMLNYYEDDTVTEGGIAAFEAARLLKVEDGKLAWANKIGAIAVDRVTLDPTKSPVSVRLYNTHALPVDVYALTLETLTNAEMADAVGEALARANAASATDASDEEREGCLADLATALRYLEALDARGVTEAALAGGAAVKLDTLRGFVVAARNALAYAEGEVAVSPTARLDGATLKATFEVVNTGDKAAPYVLGLAAYDASGGLVGVTYSEDLEVPAGTTGQQALELELGTATQAVTWQAFGWDGMGARVPLGEASGALDDLRIKPSSFKAPASQTAQIHVSPTGSDVTGDGTEQNPYQSVRAAVAAILTYNKGDRTVEVLFHAGTYPVSEETHLTYAYSGFSAEHPLIFKAAGDGEVVFSGATELRAADFVPVTDVDVLRKLPEGSRGKVVAYDLAAHGIDLSADDAFFPELLVDGTQQTMARYPNVGYVHVPKEDTTKGIVGTDTTTKAFTIDDPHATRWVGEEQAIAVGAILHNYEWSVEHVSAISAVTGGTRLETETRMIANGRFFIQNLPQELDVPSEYCVDREAGMLYWYPDVAGGDLASHKLEMTTFADDFFSLGDSSENGVYNRRGKGVSNVVFDGLTFRCAGGGMLFAQQDATNVTVTNCNFYALQGTIVRLAGVWLDGEEASGDFTISNNYAYGCGGQFVALYSLKGRLDLTPSDITVENNRLSACGHISRPFGLVFVGSGGGGMPHGVAPVTRHNLIQDCLSASGITVPCPLAEIQYNEICNQGRPVIDNGDIYIDFGILKGGQDVSYNYLHDDNRWPDMKSGYYKAVYFDGTAFGSVHHNVIQRVHRPINGGGVYGANIHDNLLLDTTVGILDYDDLVVSYNKGEQYDQRKSDLQNLASKDYASVYYSEFPGMEQALDREPFWAPWGLQVSGNVQVWDPSTYSGQADKVNDPSTYQQVGRVATCWKTLRHRASQVPDERTWAAKWDAAARYDGSQYTWNNDTFVDEIYLYGTGKRKLATAYTTGFEPDNPDLAWSDNFFEDVEMRNFKVTDALLGQPTVEGQKVSDVSKIGEISMDDIGIQAGAAKANPKLLEKVTDAPTQAYPADGDTAVPTDATLSWHKVRNASSYTVTVSKSADLSNAVQEMVGGTDAMTAFQKASFEAEATDGGLLVWGNASTCATPVLEPNTTYYWQVTANGIARQDQFANASEVMAFTTLGDGSVPTGSAASALSLLEGEVALANAGVYEIAADDLATYRALATASRATLAAAGGALQAADAATLETRLYDAIEALRALPTTGTACLTRREVSANGRAHVEGAGFAPGALVSVCATRSGETAASHVAIARADEAGRLSVAFAVAEPYDGYELMLASKGVTLAGDEDACYVAPYGSDENPGTIAAPFATIAHAASVMQPGDTCYIREGTYRELLSDYAHQNNGDDGSKGARETQPATIPKLEGTEEAPFTFRAYGDEKVTLAGTEPVTNWTKVEGSANVWRASMDWDVYLGKLLGSGTPLPESLSDGIANGNLVFAGGKPCIEGRWPNAYADDKAPTTAASGIPDSIMDLSRYAVTDEGTGLVDSVLHIVDDQLVTTAATSALPSGTDLTGAQLWIAGGDAYESYTYLISGHNTQTGTLSLDMLVSAGNQVPGWTRPRANNIYYVTNSLSLVDQPGEWYKDVKNRQLYLCVGAGEDPNAMLIEAKKRDYAIDLNESSYVTFEGIDVYGGIVSFSGRATHCTLTRSEVQATDVCQGPTSYSAGWGQTNGYGRAQGVNLGGTFNTVTRCDFHDLYGEAVRVQGSDNLVVNNRVHRANMEHSSDSGAVQLEGQRQLVGYNTIDLVGRLTIGGTFEASEICYNDLSGAMRLSRDGGVIYLNFHNYENSVLHHNVLHGACEGDGYRVGFYIDPLTQGLQFHHNLIYGIEPDEFDNAWDVSRNDRVGTNRQTLNFGPFEHNVIIANNTFINTCPTRIVHWDKDPTPDYGGCLMANNLFRSAAVEYQTCDLQKLGWTFTNNLDGTQEPRIGEFGESALYKLHFREGDFTNEAAHDYTLKVGSSAIDAGIEIPGITDDVEDGKPDVGAYERGQDAWSAGCNLGTDLTLRASTVSGVPMVNVLLNGNFETYAGRGDSPSGPTDNFRFRTSDDWTKTGSITSYYSSAWNWYGEITGDGSYAMRMQSGAKLSQQVGGLKPNTLYAVAGYGRVASDYILGNKAVVGWDKDGNALSSVAPQGGIGAARTLQFKGVDFGAEGADRLIVGISGSGLGSTGEDLIIRVRLDNRESGMKAGELLFDHWRAYGNKHEWLTIPFDEVVTGTHDVYLEFDTSLLEQEKDEGQSKDPDKIGNGSLYGFFFANSKAEDTVTITAKAAGAGTATLLCQEARYTRPQRHAYVRTGSEGTIDVEVTKTGAENSSLFGWVDTLSLYEVFPELSEVSLPDGRLLERVASQLDERGVAYLREGGALKMAGTDIAQVTSLDLSGADIASLAGMDSFGSLERVDVGGNHITDFSPLADLRAKGLEVVGESDQMSASTVPAVDTVIPDSGLYQAIIDQLEADGIPYATDATLRHLQLASEANARFTRLEANHRHIKSVAGLEAFTCLTWIDLSNNLVTTTAPFAGMSDLAYLDLYDNAVRDLSGLANHAYLEHLNLGDNNERETSAYADMDLSALPTLSALTWFDFSRNKTAEITGLVKGLTNLSYLDLTDNNLKDLYDLAGLTKMKVIILNHNSGIAGLAPLRNMVDLEELHAAFTHFYNEGSEYGSDKSGIDAIFEHPADPNSELHLTKLKKVDLLCDWNTYLAFDNGATKNLVSSAHARKLYRLFRAGRLSEFGYYYTWLDFDGSAAHFKKYADAGYAYEWDDFDRSVDYRRHAGYAHTDANGVRYISYQDFDAHCDGTRDDYYAIFSAHQYANLYGCEVRATINAADAPGKTFHIYNYHTWRDLTASTSIDWQGANFVIHDENVDHYPSRHFAFLLLNTAPVGSTSSTTPAARRKTIDNPPINVGKSLGTGSTSIAGLSDKVDAAIADLKDAYGYNRFYVMVTDDNKRQYKRHEGLGYRVLWDGYAQWDGFIVGADGTIETPNASTMLPHGATGLSDADYHAPTPSPVQWDFDGITKVEIIPIPAEKSHVRNAHFVTMPLEANGETPRDGGGKPADYRRCLDFRYCANLEIAHITQQLGYAETGYDRNELSGSYYGFFTINHTADLEMHDCTAWDRVTETSSYGIQLYQLVDARLTRVSASNPTERYLLGADGSRWGLMGDNYGKHLLFDHCTLGRIDAHMGFYDLAVRDCNIGGGGLCLTGQGPLTVERTGVYSRTFLAMRSDYGSTWDGDAHINDCTQYWRRGSASSEPGGFSSSTPRFSTPTQSVETRHDFGYPVRHPNLYVRNFTLDNRYFTGSTTEYSSTYGILSNYVNGLQYYYDYWPDVVDIDGLHVVNYDDSLGYERHIRLPLKMYGPILDEGKLKNYSLRNLTFDGKPLSLGADLSAAEDLCDQKLPFDLTTQVTAADGTVSRQRVIIDTAFDADALGDRDIVIEYTGDEPDLALSDSPVYYGSNDHWIVVRPYFVEHRFNEDRSAYTERAYFSSAEIRRRWSDQVAACLSRDVPVKLGPLARIQIRPTILTASDGGTTLGSVTEGVTHLLRAKLFGAHENCEHVWGAWADDVKPTCTTAGRQRRVCAKDATHVQLREVEALGHAWGDVSYAWSENHATVTATRTCIRDASHVETETVTTTAQVTREATQTRPGTMTYTARFVNPAFATQARNVEIPALGGWGPWVVVTPATCRAAGLERRVSVLDASEVEERVIPALGHAWNAGTITRMPTCEETGRRVRVCAHDASHTLIVELPALGHDWGEGVVTTSPTCETPGAITVTCRRDPSHTHVEKLSALGHDWGAWETAVPATCDAAGRERRACRRDASHVETRELAALGHELEAVAAVPATCEEGGMEAHWRCGRCGRLFRDAGGLVAVEASALTVTALGHDWDAGVVTRGPTYRTPGELTRTCRHDPTHVHVESLPVLDPRADAPSISARGHVQGMGWLPAVGAGHVCGTVGRSRRLEALELSVVDAPVAGGIECRAHVQGIGWQAWVQDGGMAGTVGQGRRVEAIECRLTGELAEGYDLWYRVHAQGIGWMGWASSGLPAGTVAQGRRVEAIEFQVLPAGVSAHGGTTDRAAYLGGLVSVQARVQNLGWGPSGLDGGVVGSVGRGLRLEALRVVLPAQPFDGGISYRAHVQGIGWQSWVADGEVAGVAGTGRRIEAVELCLAGEMAEHYDLWCQAHVQGIGWMGWVRGGITCGTTGRALRLEALRVMLLPKGSATPEGR